MSYNQKKMSEIADKIIQSMQDHGTDWIKPFTTLSNLGGTNLPKNVRGTYYTGINSVMLSMERVAEGFNSNTWMTFKQVNEQGGKVLKGSKSTCVCFMSQSVKEKPDGEAEAYSFLKFYNVFNIDQTDLKLVEKPVKALPEVEKLANIDNYVLKTKAVIKHEEAGRCYYMPSQDMINMSPVDSWKPTGNSTAQQNYYSTLLHELIHWTGHKSRIDRLNKFSYAEEELIAELGSGLLCNLLGISKEPSDQHAKYLNSWIKAISDKPKALFQATAQAQKAINFMDDLQQVKEAKTA